MTDATLEKSIALLKRAIEYDQSGRKMEALKLYCDGIDGLMILVKAEPNPDRKKNMQLKVSEYMDRAEVLRTSMNQWTTKGEIKDKIHIMEGVKGYSYEKIFGKYLDDTVLEITVEEPYLREHYQILNLVMFCELVVSKCRNLKFIRVTTTTDQRRNSDQLAGFNSLKASLEERKIGFNVDFSEQLHDRQVILSNGYVIKIGRGLNYFKGTSNKFCLGTFNFDFRECRETNIDILFCPDIRK